jgi:hypothetical protein
VRAIYRSELAAVKVSLCISILIRHLLCGCVANATFSYLEKALHRKAFIKKIKAVALKYKTDAEKEHPFFAILYYIITLYWLGDI